MERLNKKGASGGVLIAGVILLVLVVASGFGYFIWRDQHTSLSISGSQSVPIAPNLNTQCSQNPAYTFSAVDSFASGTSVGGTNQIKNNGDAPVSSLANPKAGVALQFWQSNATYFCPVGSDNAACGSNTLQTRCIQNGTVTLAVRDLDNDVSLSNSATAGTQNLTVGANEVHNLEFRTQSAAKKAVAPYGGCVAVEFPTTITDVAISGYGIDTSKACPFPWTYSVSSTSNTYRLYALPDGFDKDGKGDLKRISLQLKSGSSNPSGTWFATFQPANYYVGNDGQFYLGIEKDKNADTTKTMAGGATFSGAIA